MNFLTTGNQSSVLCTTQTNNFNTEHADSCLQLGIIWGSQGGGRYPNTGSARTAGRLHRVGNDPACTHATTHMERLLGTCQSGVCVVAVRSVKGPAIE